MRVGISALQLARANSGIGQYIYNLISRLLLIDEGDFYIYTSRGNARQEWKHLNGVVIREFEFKKHQVARRNLFELFTFGRVLERDRLSVFWAPDAKIPLIMPCKLPIIVTVHDLAIFKEANTYQKSRVIYWRKLFRRAVGTASRIVAISNTTKQDLVDIMGVNPEKIVVVYNGVDERYRVSCYSQSLDDIRRKYLLPPKYLLFVGIISPRKNLSTLLKSLALLKTKYRMQHKLVIVGEKGWLYRDVFRLVSTLGLEQSVIFTGFIDDVDLPAVYRMADVFVYPSLYEGFGLPVVEAMASGVPVVTSARSALPEVAGDAALLVDPRDAVQIGDAVYRVLTDPSLRQRLISKGLSRSREFSWEDAAQKLHKLFTELAGETGDRAL